jgi:putative CocE/NonD family hydrolase
VRLTVGPWTHASPRGMGEAVRDSLEWFDQHVGATRGPARRAPVRLFVMGRGQWEDFAEWPPPADLQTWYLGRGGTLSTGTEHDGAPDRFRYDPADPTPSAGGPALLWKSAGRKDQQPREDRADVVSYSSPVLTDDVTVIGPISVQIHLRSSLDYTDVFVRLCDVSSQGRSTNLSDGIVRLSPDNVTKDDDSIFRVTVPMWPTANTFKAGHRIRLQVSGGAFPLFARNTGSGEALATASKLCLADQEIWHDANHPSILMLPVVSLGRA